MEEGPDTTSGRGPEAVAGEMAQNRAAWATAGPQVVLSGAEDGHTAGGRRDQQGGRQAAGGRAERDTAQSDQRSAYVQGTSVNGES